jgi:soluble lytic murein transglycosylase
LELTTLQLFEEAANELHAITPRHKSNREDLKFLLAFTHKAHAYEVGIQLAIRHFGEKLKQGKIPQISKVWSAAYPSGYLPIIQTHTQNGLDPFLVAGIIREESLYNPRAASRVGALGLMQLMPGTAAVVARDLGLPPPEREALFDVQTNIHLGTAYISQLLHQFKGNLVHAVAAYNAGTTAVRGWISRNGHREADEFVESISYRETRNYVKRVLGSYRIYHVLSSGFCQSASLDTVC